MLVLKSKIKDIKMFHYFISVFIVVLNNICSMPTDQQVT